MSGQGRKPAPPRASDKTVRERPAWMSDKTLLPKKPPKSARGASNRPPRKDDAGP